MILRFFNTFEPVTPIYRELLPALSRQGHAVEAVMARQRYREGELRDLDGAARFQELPTFRLAFLTPWVGRLPIHVSYAVSAMCHTLWRREDCLHVFLTQPPMFNLWGAALKRIHRQPFGCIIMDLYPWVAFQALRFPSHRMLRRILGRLEVRGLNQARFVVAIGRCMKERLVAFGVRKDIIHVIPNSANTQVVYPVPAAENPLKKALSLQDKFVVMYSGNMGASHYFNDILEVAKRCRKEKNIVFVFAGEGVRKKEIEEFKSRHNLDNIILTGYQNYEMLAESLSLGDIHFVSLRDGFEGLVVPSKAYGVMAAGRPMIYQGNESGEIAKMILEENIGTVVPQGQVESLQNDIRNAAENRAVNEEKGNRARNIALNRYSMQKTIERYLDLFPGCDIS